MKKRKNTALDIAVATASVALLVVGSIATSRLVTNGFGVSTANAASRKATRDLLEIARTKDDEALRHWLVAQGPDESHRIALQLDNANDSSANVRLQILRAVDSLGAEGLSEEASRSWALALRSLANATLHQGPEQADFIARSYVMEGRYQDAALEYRRYPTNGAAVAFFKSYPDLRAPASVPATAQSLQSTRK